MGKPRIYALVKLPNGQVVKRPVEFGSAFSKIERKLHRDADSGLFLYKKKYEYLDKKNKDTPT